MSYMRPHYSFCRTGANLIYVALCRGRVFGQHNVPREGGVLLVSNHQSFFDPILATMALPRECNYMARDTLFRNYWFKKLISSLNAFPVKRGTADIGAIKETLRRLKSGGLVNVFPEGTRTQDGSVRPMQSGVVLIARRAGVPIVPCMILGAYEIWPRHATFPKPGPVIVAYGKALRLEEMAGKTDEECIEIVRQRIIAMMERYSRHSLVRNRLIKFKIQKAKSKKE
jgi:1-acyl-sn-glycerol-3-phosphate acyltransferase